MAGRIVSVARIPGKFAPYSSKLKVEETGQLGLRQGSKGMTELQVI